MANLLSEGINRPYLHSTPHTFLVQGAEVNIGGYIGEGKDPWMRKNFEAAIGKIEILKSAAEQRENSFYNSFKDKNGNMITSAAQWADSFLVHKDWEQGQGSLSQDVMDIFNSTIMKDSLLELNRQLDDAEILNRINNLKKSGNTAAEEFQKIFSEIIESHNVIEAIELAISSTISTARLNDKKKSDKEILAPILDAIEVGLSEKITTKGRAKNVEKKEGKDYGRSLKQAKRAIIRKNTPQGIIIQRNKEILTKELEKRGYSDEIIIQVCNKWEELIINKLANVSLVATGDYSNIVGGIQENGNVLSFSLIQKGQLAKDIQLNVSTLGQELVNRVGSTNKVDSKTDTLIEIIRGKTANKYRISEKNSFAEVYNDLRSLAIFDKKLKQSFAKATVQREMSLEHFYTVANKIASLEAGQGKLDLFTDEDAKALSYLLVNLLTLGNSAYKKPPWSKDKSRMGDKYKSKIKGIVEQLTSLNAISYFADIPAVATNLTNINAVDFIIYQSRILIPMSYIYEDIITFLQEQIKEEYKIGVKKSGNRTQLQTSFNFKYPTAIIKKMNEEKEVFPPDASQDYGQEEFTKIGFDAGQNVLSNISINTIQLEVDPNKFINLVARTFN